MKTTLVIAALVLLAGCKEEKLSFDSLESARKQANDNSEFNANAFRQHHPEYSAYSIDMRGDSTQSAECGQGDGWASIDLVKITGQIKDVVSLKCSTTAASIGCLTDEDFKTRPYAPQNNVCNPDITLPFPKIQK